MTKHLQSIDEMKNEMIQAKSSNGYEERLYKPKSNYKVQADEHRAEMIQEDIRQGIEALNRAQLRGKVNLNDVEEVKARTGEYLEACALSGTFPSVMGLASKAFGVSRQAINQYINTNPGTASTEYIRSVKDLMADILTNASLNNNANPIQVIFQLKNHFEHSDKVEIQATTQPDPLFAGSTPEEISKRYAEYVVTDD